MTGRSREKDARSGHGALTLVALLLAFLAITRFSSAQGPMVEKGVAASSSTSRRADEKPTFWLVDENGSWRAPLPNWTLEEVMRIVDSRAETQSVTPWSIQSVDASGEVADGIARLRVELEINVADGMVRAPLGLSEGVYIPTAEEEESGESRRGGFSYEGPGLCVLDVDRETGEYVALFQTPFPGMNAPAEARAPEKDAADDQENASSEENAAQNSTDENAEEGSVAQESAEENGALETSSRDSGRLRPNFYRLTLDLCFAIETPGAAEGDFRAARSVSDDTEYRLVATFPPSLHSQLTFTVPIPDVEYVSVKGAAVDTPTTMNEETSEIKLRGLGRGGERVEVGWRRDTRRAENARQEERVVFQVEDAQIDAELDARGTSWDVTLPIRAFGGESDVFRVELPPGAALIPESVSAVGLNGMASEVASVNVVDFDAGGSEDASDSGTRVVEVRLAQKTSVVTLGLRARTLVADAVTDPAALRAPRHLTGFSVLGAQKQFGQVRVVKSQDYDFSVSPVYGASPALENAPEDGVEIYSFFSQPFLMTAEGYARETVVDARPEYLTLVSVDELRLRARFLYSVYGSKIRDVRFRLNGWRLAKVVDPERLLNQEGIVPANDAGEMIAPLTTPTDGELALEFEFVHDVNAEPIFRDSEADPADLASCSVSFPTPIAARVEPASVVVLPDNDVRLTPYDEQILGLTRRTARTFTFNLELPSDARQTPLYYQTRLTDVGDDVASAPLFVADIRRMKQEVRVDVRTEASLTDKGQFHVTETLEYHIEHEPLETFEFQALTRLLDAAYERGVKCFVDGRQQNLRVDAPETPTSVDPETQESEEPRAPAKSRFTTCRVVVDSPRIGSCVVTLQYDLDPIDVREGLTNQVRVDLFQPKTDDSAWNSVTNELTLSAPVGMGLSFSRPPRARRGEEEASDAGFQSFWNAEPRRFSDDGRLESIRCTSLVTEFTARFSASIDVRERGATLVDRAWVQSWFSETARVDRIVWKMNSSRDYVELRLPERCSPDRVSVKVDGEQLPVGGDARRRLVFHDHLVRIPIDQQRQRKEITLEVMYVVSAGVDSHGHFDVEFPDFAVDSVWIRRVYWQTIFNRNRIVVVDPHEWTPEFVVKRGAGLGALFYRRVPTMTQDELSDWLGVERREPIPQEANVYLYSRFCQPSIHYETTLETQDDQLDAPLPKARLVALNNITIVFGSSGLVLALGLGLVYLQNMSVRMASFMRASLLALCALALIFASLRPLIALLFLQTTALGALLTLATAALAIWLGRRENRKGGRNGDEKNAAGRNG